MFSQGRSGTHTASLPEDESFTKTMSEAQDAKSDP